MPSVPNAQTNLVLVEGSLIGSPAQLVHHRHQFLRQRVADGVALEVRDHGPGVPDDVATKVFERFYRADPSRGRTGGGGSGLGLAIVKAIAEAHGGSVACLTSPLGGARFVVSLPAGG